MAKCLVGAKYRPSAYSTTDWILTGETWIDGKPIYMKVYSGPISASSAVAGIDGIETVVSYGGCAKRSDVQEWFTLPYSAIFTSSQSPSNFTISFLVNTSGELELRCLKGGEPTALADAKIWVKATRL